MALQRTLLFCAALTATFPGFAVASDFKTLIQEQLDSSATPPQSIPFSYLVTINIDSKEGKDEAENFKGQYRFDPSAEPGNRIKLIGQTWDDIPKDMRKELEKNNLETTPEKFAKDFWCMGDRDTLDILASDDVTILREDSEEAVISLSPEAISHFMSDDTEGKKERKMPKKIRKRMRAEMTFSKPDLIMTQSRIWLSEPTTVKIVAKMKEMDFQEKCAVAPNGLPYLSESRTIIAGKAMGKSFGANVNVFVSDLQPN